MGAQLTGEAFQEGALAAAAGAHHADHFSTLQLDGDIVHRCGPAVIAVGDIPHREGTDDIALLLDDAVPKMATEILTIPDRDGLAFAQPGFATHRGPPDDDRLVGPEDF